LHVTARRHRDLGDALEVVRVRGDDHIHVLRPTQDAPGVHGQPADYDELNACFAKARQKFVEGRLAQALRAAPVNRISM
jgi:hypothetical protein